MALHPSGQVPAYYRLEVGGHLDDHWSAWFGGLALTHDHEGTTTLSGPVCDQAELHGVLSRIRDLGVPLISVTMAAPGDRGPAGDLADQRSPRPVQ